MGELVREGALDPRLAGHGAAFCHDNAPSRLMGWPTPSTVRSAEGHRDDRQRGFNTHPSQGHLAITLCSLGLAGVVSGRPGLCVARMGERLYVTGRGHRVRVSRLMAAGAVVAIAVGSVS